MEKTTYSITQTSRLTGVTRTKKFEMTPEQFAEYSLPSHQRRLLQLIFPELSADDREFLISGITPEEWEAEFGPEPDTSYPE